MSAAPWIPVEAVTEVTFPVLAVPWWNQYWVQYDPDTHKFTDEGGTEFTLPHLEPNVPFIVYGELGVSYPENDRWIRKIILKEPIVEDLEFHLIDVNLPDLIANSRVYQMVNLPKQPAGVVVPRAMQFAGKTDLNQYLKDWKEEGYAGMIVKGLQNMLYEVQYSIVEPIP